MTNHCWFTFIVVTEISDLGVQHYHMYWFKHIILVDCATRLMFRFCVQYRKMEVVGFYYSNTSHYDWFDKCRLSPPGIEPRTFGV